MKKKDEDAYCFHLLKEGLTESDMSGAARAFCIGIGLVGTFTVDPVLWISRKLNLSTDGEIDPNNPTDPSNTIY